MANKYILIDTASNKILYDGIPKTTRELARLLNVAPDSLRRCRVAGKLLFRRILIMSTTDINDNADFLSRCVIVPTSKSDMEEISTSKFDPHWESGWYAVFRQEWEDARLKILNCG